MSRRGYDDEYERDSYERDYYARESERDRDHRAPVRERERERDYEQVDVVRRREREPDFLRDDYGRTDAGPLVVKERERRVAR